MTQCFSSLLSLCALAVTCLIGRSTSMSYSMRTPRYRFTVWIRYVPWKDFPRTALPPESAKKFHYAEKQRRNEDTWHFYELYDLKADPMETANLANRGAYAPLVKELKELWWGGWCNATHRAIAVRLKANADGVVKMPVMGPCKRILGSAPIYTQDYDPIVIVN